jgi:hypothetical protein
MSVPCLRYESRLYEQDGWNGKEILALADTEYLGAAVGTNALSCRPLVLQRHRFWILNLNLFPAFHAICLSHGRTSKIALAKQSSKPERICQ